MTFFFGPRNNLRTLRRQYQPVGQPCSLIGRMEITLPVNTASLFRNSHATLACGSGQNPNEGAPKSKARQKMGSSLLITLRPSVCAVSAALLVSPGHFSSSNFTPYVRARLLACRRLAQSMRLVDLGLQPSERSAAGCSLATEPGTWPFSLQPSQTVIPRRMRPASDEQSAFALSLVKL